jgi:tetratricopeptide (TPR) repeat protein
MYHYILSRAKEIFMEWKKRAIEKPASPSRIMGFPSPTPWASWTARFPPLGSLTTNRWFSLCISPFGRDICPFVAQLFPRRDMPPKLCLSGKANEEANMKCLFRIRAAIAFIAVLSLLFPVLSLAQTGFGAMDLKALAEQAEQLSKRLDINPSDQDALRNLGTIRYYMAVRDSKTFAKEAAQSLERALQAKPDDNEVLCYLGSAYLMMARDESNPITQISYLGKGLESMDEAVKKSPDGISIRMIRGFTTKAMPVFLNRRSTAYEDFEYIANLIEKGSEVQSSTKIIVYSTLMNMYKEDENNEKARKYQTLAEKVGE